MYKKNIETKVLILAKAKMSDLEDIYNNFWSQKETSRYMLWTPLNSIEEAKERLIKVINYQKNNMAYFVYEKKSGKAIGIAGMEEIEPHVYEDAGIGFGKDYVGKGYGKQILKAFIDYIFNNLNGEKILCSCDRRNIRSAKMQLACGLKYSHTENTFRKRDGEPYIADYYVIYKQNNYDNI